VSLVVLGSNGEEHCCDLGWTLLGSCCFMLVHPNGVFKLLSSDDHIASSMGDHMLASTMLVTTESFRVTGLEG